MFAKEPKDGNIVRQHALLCETVRKEKETQLIYTKFSMNPYFLGEALAPKIYSPHKMAKGTEDEEGREIIRRSKKVPRDRFPYPMTEGQLFGWFPGELVPLDRDDERLYHPRNRSSITKFMDYFFGLKERLGDSGKERRTTYV